MSEEPRDYLLTIEIVQGAVRAWLSVHPGVRPTIEFPDPSNLVIGTLGVLVPRLERFAELVRFDEAGLDLAQYVTARVPRATLLMLITALEQENA